MKLKIEALALLGGTPLYPQPLAVGTPSSGPVEDIQRLIGKAFQRNILTNDGPLVRELEWRCADFLEVPHCIAVSNATVGLQLVAQALGLRGEVLMPSFTFVGTANALRWLGLTPVFCDVRPDTHNLDLDDAQRRLSSASCAVLPVHLWGHACDTEALEQFARHHGLQLFYDAAHAFGCSGAGGRMLGGHGRAEVFSFHATKAMHAMEGGLITTHDPGLAGVLRGLRNFGFVGEDRIDRVGINAKMNEASAAVGLVNLEHFQRLVDHNIQVQHGYRRGLGGAAGVQLRQPDPLAMHNHHYAVLELGADCPLQRDVLRDLLVAEGVLARRYFRPGCHRMAPYCGDSPDLPVTSWLSEHLITLPTGRQLSPSEAVSIGQLIAFCLENADAIVGHLAQSQRDGLVRGVTGHLPTAIRQYL